MSTARSGGSDADEAGTAHGGDLVDPARLRALEHTGLGAEPDPEMEHIARWVRRALGVPVAFVSLVQAEHQVFPGMAGLPEPWATSRFAPLRYSFCRHVVTSGAPLVITDARRDRLVREEQADAGGVAYAGMPLTDGEGHVLGSLSVMDREPRIWSDDQIDTLRDIARACSTELRLRLARYDAGREGNRREEFEQAQRRAFERSQTLLLASQAFTRTRTVQDVRARIAELVTTELRPTYVGVVLLDERGRLQHVDADPDGPAAAAWADVPPGAPPARTVPLTARVPSATAIREQRVVHHLDRGDLDRSYPAPARETLHELGLESLVAVPLWGADEPVGAVVLGWPVPHAITPAGLLTITTIAGYAGQALDRARLLHHRISVAHELQAAMLTTLPAVEGLSMDTRYEPADSRENVGGDWFDAAPVHDPSRPDEQILAVSVGDVIGHTLHAATIMGQARSMLRQSAWDHPGGPPSLILHAFETAGLGLDLRAAGTAVVALLCRSPASGWSMTWTNAGHPPPILLLPDGRIELLAEHDPLFGFRSTASFPRRDQRRELAPGTTVFLYTDGLVERRDRDIDMGIDALTAVLEELRDRPTREIVDATVERLARDASDDVVAFAIRIP
jgi:GAF domain-containing protein